MKNMVKNKIIKIRFPALADYDVHIEFCSDLYDTLLKYEHTEDVDPDSNIDGLTVHVNDEGTSYIFLPHNADINSVVHECWHVIHRMTEYLGIESDNEFIAYHLGYLVQQVENRR